MSDTDDDGLSLPKMPKQTGYGNPPVKRRFKQSGNIKGRLKGSKNRKSIVREIAKEMHTVNENGQSLRRSTIELIVIRLRNLAIECKDTRAHDEFHRLMKIFQPQTTQSNVGVLVAPAPLSELAWIRKAEDGNRFSISPEEKSDRVSKIIKNNPEISKAQAQNQVEKELKTEKLKILETEKLHRAEEFRKADPTIDFDESIRRAEAARSDWLTKP